MHQLQISQFHIPIFLNRQKRFDLVELTAASKIAVCSAERIKMTWIFQFSFYLASKYKTSDVFRRTFFVGRLSFSTTSRKRSKLVWPFNYSLTIQVCVANIPLNYYHRHFYLNIGKGLSCFDWVWTALLSTVVFLMNVYKMSVRRWKRFDLRRQEVVE